MSEASTGIKKAVKYYGSGHRGGAHIPLNFALISDLNKDSDARDIKYMVDRWLTYKPLKKPANWVVSTTFFHTLPFIYSLAFVKKNHSSSS